MRLILFFLPVLLLLPFIGNAQLEKNEASVRARYHDLFRAYEILPSAESLMRDSIRINRCKKILITYNEPGLYNQTSSEHYDHSGNLVKKVSFVNGVKTETIRCRYNKLGLRTVYSRFENDSLVSRDSIFYSANGKRERIVSRSGNDLKKNTETIFLYDQQNRLIRVTTSSLQSGSVSTKTIVYSEQDVQSITVAEKRNAASRNDTSLRIVFEYKEGKMIGMRQYGPPQDSTKRFEYAQLISQAIYQYNAAGFLLRSYQQTPLGVYDTSFVYHRGKTLESMSVKIPGDNNITVFCHKDPIRKCDTLLTIYSSPAPSQKMEIYRYDEWDRVKTVITAFGRANELRKEREINYVYYKSTRLLTQKRYAVYSPASNRLVTKNIESHFYNSRGLETGCFMDDGEYRTISSTKKVYRYFRLFAPQ